jgi:hypothetical protein
MRALALDHAHIGAVHGSAAAKSLELSITCTFNAARELVYGRFTEPAHIVH